MSSLQNLCTSSVCLIGREEEAERKEKRKGYFFILFRVKKKSTLKNASRGISL
jgi:hypothetical protein